MTDESSLSLDAKQRAYVERVRLGFPRLRWKAERFLTHGGDHDVLLFDERLVFRFPKREDYLARFRAEIRLLADLGGRLPLAVPQYRYLPPERDFGGYAIVPGAELRPHHVAAIPPRVRRRIAAQLGEFITALHRAPVEAAVRAGFERDYWWNPASAADRYRLMRAALQAHLSEAEVRWLDDQFEWYVSRRPGADPVILHSDLAPDHLFYDPQRNELTGIIDFADLEIGDAAIDFAGLWDYGERFAEETLESYGGAVDPEFRERSRFIGRVLGAEIMYESLQGKVFSETFADGRLRLQAAMSQP